MGAGGVVQENGRAWSCALEDGGDPLADADAHRRQPKVAAPAAELVNERRHHSRARGAEGMAERDGAAIHIDGRRIEPELAHAGDRLRRERLVQLDQIEIGDR